MQIAEGGKIILSIKSHGCGKATCNNKLYATPKILAQKIETRERLNIWESYLVKDGIIDQRKLAR
jgi:hypothetical protein